jgi:aspartate/methionine/tyrosine aminotransferase
MALSDGRRWCIPTPVFDSIPEFAREATGLSPLMMRCDPFSNNVRARDLAKRVPTDSSGLILVSPGNPSGGVFSSDDLRECAEVLGAQGKFLLVDHCFALVGKCFGNSATTLSYTERHSYENVVVLWDSSKTVELAGEKVGAVLSPAAVSERVRRSFDTLQLDLAWSSLSSVDRELQSLVISGELRQRNEQIAKNQDALSRLGRELGLQVAERVEGSLSIISVPLASAAFAKTMAIDFGVGVMPSSVLEPHHHIQNYVRINLATTANRFERALEAIHTVISRS